MSLVSRIVRAHQSRVASPIPDDVQRYFPQAGGLWWAFDNMASSFKKDLKKLGDEAKDILRANILDAAKSLGKEYEESEAPIQKLQAARKKVDQTRRAYEEAQQEVEELEQEHRGARISYRRLQGEMLLNLRRDTDAFLRKLESMPLQDVEDQFTFDQARRRARNFWSSTDFRAS